MGVFGGRSPTRAGQQVRKSENWALELSVEYGLSKIFLFLKIPSTPFRPVAASAHQLLYFGKPENAARLLLSFKSRRGKKAPT
jgi:hypothetical protein